jgi:hypothetical protein
VQNLQGSRPDDLSHRDSFTLSTGLLGRASAANLSAAAPPQVAAGEPFRLDLAWSLADARPGDVYLAVVGLGSAPDAPGNRGALALTLTYNPNRLDLPLLRR